MGEQNKEPGAKLGSQAGACPVSRWRAGWQVPTGWVLSTEVLWRGPAPALTRPLNRQEAFLTPFNFCLVFVVFDVLITKVVSAHCSKANNLMRSWPLPPGPPSRLSRRSVANGGDYLSGDCTAGATLQAPGVDFKQSHKAPCHPPHLSPVLTQIASALRNACVRSALAGLGLSMHRQSSCSWPLILQGPHGATRGRKTPSAPCYGPPQRGLNRQQKIDELGDVPKRPGGVPHSQTKSETQGVSGEPQPSSNPQPLPRAEKLL